jgi:hypothetical protein
MNVDQLALRGTRKAPVRRAICKCNPGAQGSADMETPRQKRRHCPLASLPRHGKQPRHGNRGQGNAADVSRCDRRSHASGIQLLRVRAECCGIESVKVQAQGSATAEAGAPQTPACRQVIQTRRLVVETRRTTGSVSLRRSSTVSVRVFSLDFRGAGRYLVSRGQAVAAGRRVRQERTGRPELRSRNTARCWSRASATKTASA